MTMEFPGALGGLVAGLLLVAVTLAIALWIGRRNVGQIRRQADELRRTVGRQAEQIQELTEDRSRLAADQAALSTTTATLQAELAAGREALKKAQAARDDALALSNQLGDQLASARTDVERLELEAIDVAPVRAELERVGRLRAVLTQRLEVLTRLKQEADADRIRLTLQVEALDLQVRGAVRTGTEDQQRLSGNNRRPRLECVVRGHVGHQESGSFLEGEAFGHEPDRPCGHDSFLGVAAGAHLRDHLLPDGDARHIGRDLAHHAGRLQARHERQLRAMLVQPLDHQHVRKIDAGRPDSKPHHAWRERGPRQFAQAKPVRRPEFLANYGAISRLCHVFP